MRYLRPRNAARTVARKAKKEYFCIGGACRARIEKLLRQKMKPSKAITLLAAAVLALTAAAQTAHDTVTTEKPVTVIFLSDLHVSPGAESEARLRRAVERINRTRADAVIVAGDLTNEGSDEELRCAKSILDLIDLPTYVIPGNHEDNWSQSACRTFDALWGADRFAFEVRGTLFAGINCGPYMKMGDGHVKHEDLAWLDSLLTHNPGRRVVSVNHYPLTEDIDDWEDYADVLVRHRTAVHLCGHYHSYKRYRTAGIDGLVNRSLHMPSEEYGDEGYTLIEITRDSLRQWNVPLDGSATLVEALAVDDSPKPAVERQDAAWEQPEGYRIELLHRDEASIFTRLGIDRRRIYFGNSLGRAKAIDKRNGRELWSVATDGPLFSRPAPAGRSVMVPASDGRILTLNARNGRLRRQHEGRGPYVADGVVRDGILYQGGYRSFEAIDTRTGRLVWLYDGVGNYCQAAPSVTRRDIVFGAWDTFLHALDPATGRPLWRWNNGNTVRLYSPGNCSPAVVGERVFIVAPDRRMTAIDRATGETVWRVKDRTVRESLGISADSTTVYARTMDGELIAVDATADDYRLRWVTDLTFGYEHTPCVVVESLGTVYAASRRGMVAAVDAATGHLLWVRRVGRSAVNGFECDSDGTVYLSFIEGTVWRISKLPAAR